MSTWKSICISIFTYTLDFCCVEEIINKGADGFHGGDTIIKHLNKDCALAKFNAKTDNLRIRLVGFDVSVYHIKIKK